MSDTAVLVVGGGPVGLATGLSLARQGVEVTIVERDTQIGRAPRAMVNHSPVVMGFDELGVLDDVRARGLELRGRNNYVWARREHIYYSREVLAGVLDIPPAISLGQDEISEIFLAHLSKEPSAGVLVDTPLVGFEQRGDQVRARFHTESGETEMTAAWLVGADGANSQVRRTLGLGFDGMTWPDHLVATNVRADFESLGLYDMNFSLDPVYGGLIGKIGRTGLWRWTFRESAGQPADSYAERIGDFYRGFFGHDLDFEIDAHALYRIHQRCAPTFRVDRVLLAGDAAHITNPFGAFGLSTGFLDAFLLGETLGHVVRGQADASLLTAYAQARRAVFHEVSSPAATAQKSLLFDERPLAQRERHYALMRRTAATPAALINHFAQLMGTLTPSLVARKEQPA